VLAMGHPLTNDSTRSRLSFSDVSLEKPLNQYLVFRWAAHCLALPAKSPLLPLFWQQLAVLLLARVPARAAGGMAPAYGIRFFHGREEQLTALKKRCVTQAAI